MTDSPLSNNERRFLAFILVAIVLFVAADLFNDFDEGVKSTHLALELIIALGAAAGFFVLMKDSFRKSREVERWKLESQKYIQGLSKAIDAQLVRWSLSSSEKEVALLLLKGLSLKEIAVLRNTAEKTVRAQSVSIYSKSGLAGRSELAAYFLEDLLVPQSKDS